MLAFGLGGALAGGAGALVGPIYSLSPSMGLIPDTQAFAIVILGGMGSVAGSILAGLMIGVSEIDVRGLVSRSQPQPDLCPGVQPADPDGRAAAPPHRLVRPRAPRPWSSACALCPGAAGVVLVVAVLGFPYLVNGYWLSVGVLAMFYAIVTASWALLAGYAGQFSFGHMAFVSLGAYTSGLLVKWLRPSGARRHGRRRCDVRAWWAAASASSACACAALTSRCSPSRSPKCCASSSSPRPRSPADPAGWK